MIIKSRKNRHTEVRYQRVYHRADSTLSGYSFDCDKEGNIATLKLCKEALDNLEACRNGSLGCVDGGVTEVAWSWTEPTVGICEECGLDVEFDNFTNICECGADYNMSGQLLAPREQWGEETGEQLSDILAVDYVYEGE